LAEAVWNVGVQFDRNFSAAPLRLDDDRQADPFAACIRCRDSLFSRSTIFCATICYSAIFYSPSCYSMISSA
jgi:hypothetical protein